MANNLKRFAKLVFSVVVLGFLAQKVSLQEIVQTIKSVNAFYAFLILLFVALGMWRQSERWRRLILLPDEQKPSSVVFFRYTTIGFFFNLFLPSGFGGDAVRSVGLGREFQMMGKSIASTIVARVLGLQALVAYMLVGLLLLYTKIPSQYYWGMLICGGGFLLCSSILWWVLLRWKQQVSVFFRFAPPLEKLSHNLQLYSNAKALMRRSFFDSLFLQLVILLTNWFMFLALGLPVSFSAVLAVFPLVTLATMIPVTFFGIGLREWASIGLYTQVSGVTQNQIMAVLLLGYAYMLLQAFAGMIWWIVSKQKQ